MANPCYTFMQFMIFHTPPNLNNLLILKKTSKKEDQTDGGLWKNLYLCAYQKRHFTFAPGIRGRTCLRLPSTHESHAKPELDFL